MGHVAQALAEKTSAVIAAERDVRSASGLPSDDKAMEALHSTLLAALVDARPPYPSQTT
jgi:hypothetical protein